MQQTFDSLITFGKAVADAGLLTSTCGNAGLRVGSHFAISASGAYLGNLTDADIAVVELDDGHRLSGPEPSMELGIHRSVCLTRPRTHAVLHCQSRYATLLACSVDPPRNLDFIPEIPAYVRAHAYVPYHSPGGGDLAASVRLAFEDPEVTVVQMVNHGQVVIGATWEAAVRRATFFELACWMATRGRQLNVIPEEDAKILRGYSRDV